MIPSEEFLRHAAECEYMSRFSHDSASRVVWSRMAERWVRCAEFARKQDPSRTIAARQNYIASPPTLSVCPGIFSVCPGMY